MRSWPLWFPHPTAWLSAALLVLLAGVLGFGATILMTTAFFAGRFSPRLAGLLVMGAILSPIFFTAFAHHVTHRIMDGVSASTRRPDLVSTGLTPGLMSYWAGLYAWLVIVLASILTAGVLFVIRGLPDVPDPQLAVDAFSRGESAGRMLTLPGVLWFVFAAYLFHVWRVVERRLTGGA
jgi:hypothetical protein